MMRKSYTLRQRLVMATRDIRKKAECSVVCRNCGAQANGDESSWWCPKCNASGGQG